MAKCEQCGRQLSGIVFGRKVCDWCKMREAAERGEDTSRYRPAVATSWQRSDPMPMVVTQAICGICVAVFIGMTLSGASPISPSGEKMLVWGANFGIYTLPDQPWRLLASCFLHFGILHLAMNMWCLWSLGQFVERLYGHVTFACVYLLCGLAGSLASLWWHTQGAVSAGASGAIFGIAGAAIGSLKFGEFNHSPMARSIMSSMLAFVGYNVVFGMMLGITDNACHIGGLLAGLLLGALIARLAPMPKLMPRLMALAIVAALLAVGWVRLVHSRGAVYREIRHEMESESAVRPPEMPHVVRVARRG
ncbi:MAG: rhomboid family intramembrane serine protease [Acidobacteriota bacterium]|nr:rhomboid family intramembrane serine protease [Acidobacteriota bacterium]